MYTAAALLYPHALATSVTLPFEILQAASQMASVKSRSGPQVRLLLAAPEAGLMSLASGLTLQPDTTFSELPALDLLLLPAIWRNPLPTIAAMRGWLDIHKPVDLATYVAAMTERESLLFRWMSFFQQWPLLILPTLADLPPKQVADITRDGQAQVLDAMRPALLAPLLGLPGLAVPVGSHGKLRTGVQIMAMRNREDLCLDAGEVIEAAEGIVTPIDPVKG